MRYRSSGSILAWGGGPPCFPPGYSCPMVLWILPPALKFHLRDYYPLRFAFPNNSVISLQWIPQSSTPQILLLAVWPVSLSLAATQKIDVSFSSSAYLDVSVQRVTYVTLFYSYNVTQSLLCVGSPIRKSACNKIFAPLRSLSQLVTSFFGS